MAGDSESVSSQRCLNFGVIEVNDCSLIGKHVYLQLKKKKMKPFSKIFNLTGN